MSEEWKPVEFPRYEVSNLGRVRRVDTGAILAQQNKNEGYKMINICLPVHRLVAQAFIPNPENKPTVDHINQVDSKQCDNSVANLRWATSAEQVDNRRVLTLPASGHRNISYKKTKKVYVLRLKKTKWTSTREATFATLAEALVVRQQWYDEE